ncbi:ATP-dependent RNA helicase HrpA [Mycobacteroides immunogenum]|uniref:ATP-dependent RNA helicase HrpA n=1 Tax=Mycobacteroides immunogenum TaxID=83262 RepID=A0A7V8RWP2_9MYCO|nr:ATP-dependent RNA helicase HrpA [Mycobacteroides immunogenum]AMT69082.1 ATP-dependent helicase [Mycobacteroides immunogenum]ANO02104.1 ATP-dependent RNA helicase HrpA [Mycobacteroides immunogenum]KPG11407.1 ATP-dependent RNA helicase HrpA [Mycobacteroides immunogenum]KPG12378.1 ATP-dependent RNA helicase HrpA [Mycobacteroides immunogenum]KPG13848.1 ATP-dependent RNA helicase HrpA [Mycobacteroides immunogenum]
MSELSRAELRARLDGLTIRDAARLGRRLKNQRDTNPDALAKLAEQLTVAEALVATRTAAVPAITYPDLPVSEHREELARAISAHQVVVVAGATGSGKTTQLPKICLDLGRGIRGTIGHTQPRRLAARTVAERIAEELGTPLGETVGYTVRFTDQASDRTLVKLMTDGILLAEIQRDRRLLRYDTLILDEAHERSLNIDFLLGYLRELLPRRPDLKVIVTSATIEPQRFSAHFGDAPIVEVSGRTYPVEIRYRPLEVPVPGGAGTNTAEEPDDPDHEIVRTELRDQTEAIADAVRELESEPPGDVLVFLSGEREIRDTAETLRGAFRNTEVLPLYARLPTAEQHKVFAPHTGRRVVLATNVAETSLTVPGIRYVIDPGTARISRYSRRTKVQRLPIEPISQASAAQRSGRSGRTAPGICIRLYSEQDFEARPRYTDPEILRTNLAAVILQMAALQLGDIENFPFLDPPDKRSIRDGVQLLQELGAFSTDGTITDLGRRLARLPLDPRIGRMILQADAEGCVGEILVLAAALSIPDPRERPADREEAARQKHARFADDHSDFTAYLNLWRYLQDQRSQLSGSAFRRMCRDEFLHYLRIREWQDLVGQLRSIARDLGIRESGDSADPGAVHAALVAGLLSHIGLREGDTRDYSGARNTKFVLAPGSVLTKKPPRWVVVADLVETSRLFGRIAARVEPQSVERIAGDLVQRTYSEPHWDAERGAVMAFERVTLYGLPLVPRRRVGYAQVDPELARELFIRHALVEGDWQSKHHFLRDNARLLQELSELEDKARRRDLLVGDDEIYALYAARIPEEAVSARHFDAWWRKQRHQTPELLTFTRDDLLRTSDAGADMPDTWRAGDVALPVTYRFEPGAADDGVSVHIPVEVLARLGGDEFAWHVPALREELVTALIRSLPKDLRRNFVPAPDTARAVLANLEPEAEPLVYALGRELHRLSGIRVPTDAFDLDKIPPHLRMTFVVESADGTEVARDKNLDVLQQRLAGSTRQAVAAAVAGEWERSGLRAWPEDLPELPRTVEELSGGHTVRGYPALVDAVTSVDIHVFATEAEQRAAMTAGTRRLLRLSIPSPMKTVERGLDPRARLLLSSNPDGSLPALLDDCADAAVDLLAPTPVWSRTEFTALRDRTAQSLAATTLDIMRRAEKVVTAWSEVQVALPSKAPAAQHDALSDMRDQLDRLLEAGFVAATGATRLADLARYVGGIGKRLERLPQGVEADRERMHRVHAVEDAYDDLLRDLPAGRSDDPAIRDIAWFIEELRVSLWAQQLGTARAVSEQRILKAINAAR